jgi:D-serine deaminase-like pyridoxal phosphate-dependent protein
MLFTELPTPQVLVDRTRLLANLDRMQADADAHRVRLRPHAKTHKIPDVARWQMDRGAVGICCAKIGEAEVFADAGIEDIRLPYPVNPRNASRLLALMDRCRVSIIVDHPAVARGWSEVMRAAGRSLDVLIKVDVGSHRCGIDPAPPAGLSFVRLVSGLPGLRLRGLLSHAGHGYGAESERALAAVARDEAEMLRGLGDEARRDGISIEEISVGATPTARFSVAEPGVTELRPGTYAYFDRTQVAFGAARLDDCALTVLAMVVSKPTPDRIVLDCGSKTLTNDPPHGYDHPRGFGAVFANLDATSIAADLAIDRLSEEHAVVTVASGSTPLEPGDLVRVLPNHVCPVSNLVDCVRLIEGRQVMETMTVAARGKIA